MKKRKKANPIVRWLSRVFTFVCVVIFTYSIYSLVDIGLDYYYNRQLLAEVQELYQVMEVEDDNETEIRNQFHALHQINPDIVGWITVEDTIIDYPIVQTDNNEFYLNRNYKKEESRAGSIFMDYRNDLRSENENIILYGHRMKDETMFNQITKYEKKEFFDTHKKIYFDTLYGSYDAEVFAAYYTTTDFDYIQTEFDSKEEYKTLLNEMKEKSLFESEVEVNEEEQIITLSTCDYTLDPNKGRFVVHAKVVEKRESS